MKSTAQILEALSPSTITRAYSGKDGSCCCGCSGTYRETEQAKKRVIKLIRENAGNGSLDIDSSYVAVVVGTRVHIAYLETARQRKGTTHMPKPARFFRASNGHAFMVIRHDDIQVSIENLTKPWDDEEIGRWQPRRNKVFVAGRFEDYRVPATAVEISESEAY